MDKSRVEPTIFFIEKISSSLKLFSDHFYGQSFIKTVQGPCLSFFENGLDPEISWFLMTADQDFHCFSSALLNHIIKQLLQSDCPFRGGKKLQQGGQTDSTAGKTSCQKIP